MPDGTSVLNVMCHWRFNSCRHRQTDGIVTVAELTIRNAGVKRVR